MPLADIAERPCRRSVRRWGHLTEPDCDTAASIAVMEKVGLVRAPQLDRDLPVWSITKP